MGAKRLLAVLLLVLLNASRAYAYQWYYCNPSGGDSTCGSACTPPYLAYCGAATPTPKLTPEPTAAPTPIGTDPPEPIPSYNQECPGIGSVNEVNVRGDAAEGIIVINCAHTELSCADLPGNEIRGFLLTANLDWNLTQSSNQKSVSGTITPIDGPCVLALGNYCTDLWVGLPYNQTPCPPIGSCSPNCSSADYIAIRRRAVPHLVGSHRHVRELTTTGNRASHRAVICNREGSQISHHSAGCVLHCRSHPRIRAAEFFL